MSEAGQFLLTDMRTSGNETSRNGNFLLVPWQQNFLERLLSHSFEISDSKLDSVLFVFPNARPARYLERLIMTRQDIPKPCMLPAMLTSGELFQLMARERQALYTEAGLLDRIGLLLQCVKDEQAEFPGSINALPTHDAQAFFPWGLRLEKLLEECMAHNCAPVSMLHLEGELTEFAAAIIGRLSGIYNRYVHELQARQWTTPALTATQCITWLNENESNEPLSFLQQRKYVLIAGFSRPNGTEEALFKRLWERGQAEIIVHADARLLTGKWHWSCSDIAEWASDWKARFSPLRIKATDETLPPDDVKDEYAQPHSPITRHTALHYYGGYDVHSQLAAMDEVLRLTPPADGDTSIVLPETSLLMPVLHMIGTDDVNISMGYPLTRSPMSMLLECVLQLQEQKRPGGYYWKDAIRLLRHPYVKMLAGDTEGHAEQVWRKLLQFYEAKLRGGRRYIDFTQMLGAQWLRENAPPECFTDEPEAEASFAYCLSLIESLRAIFVTNWENLTLLEQVADALGELCAFMLQRGEKLWYRFPIDAECLYRFIQMIVPELSGSSLSREAFAPSVLFSLLRQLVEQQRVPFEADPLTAMQIMGLLETRLLSFRRVFLLDATDDLLPGNLRDDPLAPDGIRKELGLPDGSRRQRLAAYYFYRLINSAREVHIFWQEGVESKGLQDAKKLKSRFIEELLWDAEQYMGRLYEPKPQTTLPVTDAPSSVLSNGLRDGALHTLACRLRPVVSQALGIPKTPLIERRLRKRLAQPFSATALNMLLTCPAQFYYAELARLKELEEVTEQEDPGGAGELLHQVLRDFYAPRLGQELERRAISRTELVNMFERTLQASPLATALPQDALAMLRVAAPIRLERYLANQPPRTRILALEATAQADLRTEGPSGAIFHFTGRLDRIDERSFEDDSKGLLVLDYKTGRILPPQDFWLDDLYWQEMTRQADNGVSSLFFNTFAEKLINVQLPLYLYLVEYGEVTAGEEGAVSDQLYGSQAVYNAAWVALRANGEEHSLFPDIYSVEDRELILGERLPHLLQFMMAYLEQCDAFGPKPGGQCAYCPFFSMCHGSNV